MAASQSPRPAGEGTARPGEGSTPVPAEVWEPPAGTGHSLPQAGVSRGDRCGLLAGATGRTWTVALPAGLELLNANDRLNRYDQAAVIRGIREAAGWTAKALHIPRLERVAIVAEVRPKTTRKQDAHNWLLSVKAGIDGVIKDAGICRDDDNTYVLSVEIVAGDVTPGGQLLLHIHELETPQS